MSGKRNENSEQEIRNRRRGFTRDHFETVTLEISTRQISPFRNFSFLSIFFVLGVV